MGLEEGRDEVDCGRGAFEGTKAGSSRQPSLTARRFNRTANRMSPERSSDRPTGSRRRSDRGRNALGTVGNVISAGTRSIRIRRLGHTIAACGA